MQEQFELYNPLRVWTQTQAFGTKAQVYTDMGLAGHPGIDLVPLPRTAEFPVYAAHAGVVMETAPDDKGGFGVVIRTHKPYPYKGMMVYFKTIYWHGKLTGAKVKSGDFVDVGDLIMIGNNTGVSTGPHCHFGLKPGRLINGFFDNLEYENGYKGCIDPAPYLNNKSAYEARQTLQSLLEQVEALSAKFRAWLKGQGVN